MNLETKITIYKFTPQVFTLTPSDSERQKWEGMDDYGSGGHCA